MKILVAGAGMIGSIVALELCRENDVTLFDGSEAALERVRPKGKKITLVQGSVFDERRLGELISDKEVVVIALPGSLAVGVAEAALKRQKAVFDISSIPNDILLGKIRKLADDNKTLYVPKIGIAPGMTNFLTGRGCVGLDAVKDVKIYVGGIPQKKESPFGYKTVFCLEETLQEYLDPAMVVEDGGKKYVEALSGLHEVGFEGVGGLEAFFTDGLSTLAETIHAENMSEFTIRWPGHVKQIKNLITLGMFEKKEEDFKGAKITPREYLISRLAPLWRMDPAKGDKDLTLFRIIVRGTKGDTEVESKWETIDRYDDERGITSMGKCTAFTCTSFIRAWMNSLFGGDGFVFPEKLSDNDRLYHYIMESMSSNGVHFDESYSALKRY